MIDRVVPIDTTIPSNKLELMKETKVNKSEGSQVKYLKDLAAVLSQLYVANQVRGGDALEFFSHENVSIPPSISKDSELYHGSNADLVQELIETAAESLVADQPTVDAIIIDGPALVDMIQPKNDCTVDDYCKTYTKYVINFFNHAPRIDMVFDVYLQSNLKEEVRASRGISPIMIVKGNTKVRSWKHFLKNDANKQSLFTFIAKYAQSMVLDPSQQLVVTCRDGVLTNPESRTILEDLSPCDQEEADTRMILHAHQVLESASSVLIRTVDTDVLVLVIAATTRYDDKRVWPSFGVGDSHKIIGAHIAIGCQKAITLPIFHAFTGCDTVSAFKSIGKKTAWQRWNSFDDVTGAFLDLSTAPDNINNVTEKLLERFVVLLYDKTSTCMPTSGVLLQHDNRTLHQGCHVWGNAHVKQMNLSEPLGWIKDKKTGRYSPLWTYLLLAKHAVNWRSVGMGARTVYIRVKDVVPARVFIRYALSCVFAKDSANIC